MKLLIASCIFISSLCSAQESLKNFKGKLLFKESWYYAPITRTNYDTLISYSVYHVSEMLEIVQTASFNENKQEELNYLPIKFYNHQDTIYFKYADPFDKDHDTTYSALFPLIYNDTLLSSGCYKILMDTVRSPNKQFLTILTECDDDDSRDFTTFRSEDTSVVYEKYKLDCYKIIQEGTIGHYKDNRFTRVLLIEKNTLIPIDIKEYNYYNKHKYRRDIPHGVTLLTKHQKLIRID